MRFIMDPLRRRLARLSLPTMLVWGLMLVYVAFFSAYTIARHDTLNSFAADLSFIDQPMWNTLHGRFLERTMDARQVSRVGEHLEPIILPVALLYLLWDDVRASLIAQTVALALGALPLFWIARRAFADVQSRWARWFPVLFAFVYLMFPALQAANVADFHADPFIVAPLLFAFWYGLNGRFGWMWLWALVAMLTKENLPAVTFMLGSWWVLFPAERPDSPDKMRERGGRLRALLPSQRHGLALMAVSLVWFLVATFVIVAPLAQEVYGTDTTVYFANRYGLQGGLFAWLGTILSDPQRWFYLVDLLAPVGWLALLAPEFLLLGLPVLAANFLSDFAGQYSGQQHYSAPLAPVFVLAAVYGTRRVWDWLRWERRTWERRTWERRTWERRTWERRTWERRTWERRTPVRHEDPNAEGRTLQTASGQAGLRRPQLVWGVLAAWLLLWSVGYHYLRGWTPLGRDFTWFQTTPHTQLAQHFFDQIPPHAAVSTTPPLHPHLAHRHKVYLYPTVADADFVLLDVSGPTDAHPNDVYAGYKELVQDGTFGIRDAADGYLLLQRDCPAEACHASLPDAFYDFARAVKSVPEYSLDLSFALSPGQPPVLRCLGYDLAYDPVWHQTRLRFYWQALASLPEDLQVWPFTYSADGFVVQDPAQTPLVATLWYPPAAWEPGETVVVETLPSDLGPTFSLGVAVVRSDRFHSAEAFADPARRLSVYAAPPATRWQQETWAQVGTFARQGRGLNPKESGPVVTVTHQHFGDYVRLVGYRIERLDAETLSVLLAWRGDAALAQDYTIFVHVLDAEGNLVAQSDAAPHWVTAWPTSHWESDAIVLDGHRLSLPAHLPDAEYQIRVGMYDWQTLERLPTFSSCCQPQGDAADLGPWRP
jgi:uncharacterized membrane protein